MEPVVIGSVAATAAMAILGVEVIKKLILDKIFPPQDFNAEDRKMLNDLKEKLKNFEETEEKIKLLHQAHDAKDQDGVPLWFVPRSWQHTQQETLNATREIAFTQKETARALEGVTRVIERLADQVSNLRLRD